MTTEWSLDFCLVCDRQTLGGPYCSQSCRLAELDISHDASFHSSRATSKASPNSEGVCTPASVASRPTQPSSVWVPYQPCYQRTLSPSSSQSSLSSLRSDSSQGSLISSKSQTELRDYASCFDPVRDLRRRLTS
ncbi:hypothetical protein BJX61DRAFT_535212 [Aspergillus egyptiacus]|nr:hypothetical protein BJX61DRAFT_535212 [Aspergillus egyptiacus]